MLSGISQFTSYSTFVCAPATHFLDVIDSSDVGQEVHRYADRQKRRCQAEQSHRTEDYYPKRITMLFFLQIALQNSS